MQYENIDPVAVARVGVFSPTNVVWVTVRGHEILGIARIDPGEGYAWTALKAGLEPYVEHPAVTKVLDRHFSSVTLDWLIERCEPIANSLSANRKYLVGAFEWADEFVVLFDREVKELRNSRELWEPSWSYLLVNDDNSDEDELCWTEDYGARFCLHIRKAGAGPGARVFPS